MIGREGYADAWLTTLFSRSQPYRTRLDKDETVDPRRIPTPQRDGGFAGRLWWMGTSHSRGLGGYSSGLYRWSNQDSRAWISGWMQRRRRKSGTPNTRTKNPNRKISTIQFPKSRRAIWAIFHNFPKSFVVVVVVKCMAVLWYQSLGRSLGEKSAIAPASARITTFSPLSKHLRHELDSVETCALLSWVPACVGGWGSFDESGFLDFAVSVSVSR